MSEGVEGFPRLERGVAGCSPEIVLVHGLDKIETEAFTIQTQDLPLLPVFDRLDDPSDRQLVLDGSARFVEVDREKIDRGNAFDVGADDGLRRGDARDDSAGTKGSPDGLEVLREFFGSVFVANQVSNLVLCHHQESQCLDLAVCAAANRVR